MIAAVVVLSLALVAASSALEQASLPAGLLRKMKESMPKHLNSKVKIDHPTKARVSSTMTPKYLQYVGYENSPMCNSEPMVGYSIALYTCSLAENNNGTMFYSYFFETGMDQYMMSGVNYTIYMNDPTCMTSWVANGKAFDSTPGCKPDMYDPMFNVRTVVGSTANWPTGMGYSSDLYSSASACMTGAPSTSIRSMFESHVGMQPMDMGNCFNITTNYGTTNASLIGVSVQSCSGANFMLNIYDPTVMCQGAPMSTTTYTTGSSCNAMTMLDGAIGYGQLVCYAGMPKYNKCFNAFGMSSPPCELGMTNHALKFSCMDTTGAYDTCHVTSYFNQMMMPELFACCSSTMMM